MLDRLTRPWVLGLSRLEEVKDVLRARCRPEGEEVVIRISEAPTAADLMWHASCALRFPRTTLAEAGR